MSILDRFPTFGVRALRLLFLVGALVITAGCTTVDIINLSEINGRVLIQLPDSANGTSRQVPSAGSTSTFSTHGGRVTITTVPDEEYRDLLESLRDQITSRLFEEGATLSAADVQVLVDRLSDLDNALQDLARPGTSCSVNAPDFSAVTAILNYDVTNRQWTLDCSVSADE